MINIEDKLILSFFTQLGIKQFKKIQYLLDVCDKKTPFENLNGIQQEKYFKGAKTVSEEPQINNLQLIDLEDIFDRSTATEIKNKKLVQQTQQSEKAKNKFNQNISRMYSDNSNQQQNLLEKIYKCKKCGLIFKKQKELQFHSLSHSDPQWKNNGIVCTICQCSFRKYDEFFEHNAIHFQKKKQNY